MDRSHASAALREFPPPRRSAAPAADWTRHVLSPDDDLGTPSVWARLAIFPLVFIPWLVCYEYVVYRGPAHNAFSTYLPGELAWPIWQWTEVLYVSPYLIVTLAPFFAPTNRVLRRFVLAGLIATAIGHLIFLTVPAIAAPRPFTPTGILGQMMTWDRDMDLNNGTAACPSFHVLWSFLGAAVYAARFPRLRGVAYVWAAAVSASCVFTGMHSLIDVVAGYAFFLLVYNYAPLFDRAARLVRGSATPVGEATP
jgi:membrane-associated phospholipid phosphatase